MRAMRASFVLLGVAAGAQIKGMVRCTN
jgi:hypothetical protein